MNLDQRIAPIPFKATRGQSVNVEYRAPQRVLFFGALCGSPNARVTEVIVARNRMPFVEMTLCDETWVIQIPRGLVLERGDMIVIRMVVAGGPVDDAIELLIWKDHEQIRVPTLNNQV